MNLEESQIMANLSTGLANCVASGIVSREEAKGLIKRYLTGIGFLIKKNENNSDNAKRAETGVGAKPTVAKKTNISPSTF